MVIDLRAIQLSAEVGRDPGATGAPTRRLTPDPDAPLPSPLIDWRGFHTELQRAAITATETGAPLSLLMLEQMASDRVKQPCDSEVAAAAMGALAGALRAAVGERGLLARYSDGRLAAILIDTDLGEAVGRAERIARLRPRQRHLGSRGSGGDARVRAPLLPPAVRVRDDAARRHATEHGAARHEPELHQRGIRRVLPIGACVHRVRHGRPRRQGLGRASLVHRAR